VRQSVSVAKTGRGLDESEDVALLALFAAMASDDLIEVSRMLDETPGLAVRPLTVGASRQDPALTSSSRSTITSSRATPRCMSPRLPITDESLNCSSPKALLCGPVTEGEPNLSTTP
jgi:hypothetical protein